MSHRDKLVLLLKEISDIFGAIIINILDIVDEDSIKQINDDVLGIVNTGSPNVKGGDDFIQAMKSEENELREILEFIHSKQLPLDLLCEVLEFSNDHKITLERLIIFLSNLQYSSVFTELTEINSKRDSEELKDINEIESQNKLLEIIENANEKIDQNLKKDYLRNSDIFYSCNSEIGPSIDFLKENSTSKIESKQKRIEFILEMEEKKNNNEQFSKILSSNIDLSEHNSISTNNNETLDFAPNLNNEINLFNKKVLYLMIENYIQVLLRLKTIFLSIPKALNLLNIVSKEKISIKDYINFNGLNTPNVIQYFKTKEELRHFLKNTNIELDGFHFLRDLKEN